MKIKENNGKGLCIVKIDIAFRSFRDQGDKDYFLARKTYRYGFYFHFHWSGLQEIEKYIKCILLFNQISSCEINHDFLEGLKFLIEFNIFN